MDLHTLISATLTIFLVMDPIGNVPVFLSFLKDVDEKRKSRVVIRECLFALLILLFFLFFGPMLMTLLHIKTPALHISGGVLLFVISLGMIFPNLLHRSPNEENSRVGEPFIVPLATPFIAGPSTMATIMVFTSGHPQYLGQWVLSLSVAWILTVLILLLAPRLSRLLGSRGLVACERLMGMVLTVVAVQMILDGIERFPAK